MKIKLVAVLAIIALLVGFIPIQTMPVYAATYTIAASNSSTADKNAAHIVCDGVSDQIEINNHLTTGNTVSLYAGTFNCDGLICPSTGTSLIGQGNTSIINLDSASIYILSVDNVEVGNLKLTGVASLGGAVFLGVASTNISQFYIHDIWCTATGDNDFTVYASYGEISDIVFIRCDADTPDGMGFYIMGEGSPCLVEDITFYDCNVEDAGVAVTRESDWIAGFDFAEYSGMTLNRMQAIKCSVNGAWEADYHFEIDPTKTNCVITDCTATNAGQKPIPMFGSGYFIDGLSDIIIYDSTGGSNNTADIRVWNGGGLDDFTPAVDKIYPVASTKTTTDVSQGNCEGLIVTNGNYKELFLYSSDGNAVNQQIELGDTYESNDGETYTFNGTKIVATFTDYAVIRLVLSTASQGINGVISFATINGVATPATINGE